MINHHCLICERIQLIQKRKNIYYVTELKTGFVVIGDHQFFQGYTLFLCKEHKTELHQLNPRFRKTFLWEMSMVAEAVFDAFAPKKLNYELLGNTDQHLHWHVFPRHSNDPLPNQTVWNVPKETRNAKENQPNQDMLNELKERLQISLKKIMKKPSR